MVFGLFVCLAVVLFVLACCLCCWMGDTLVPVSPFSHAWELTILTNRLMTVRASSAHGTAKKKMCHRLIPLSPHHRTSARHGRSTTGIREKKAR